MSRIGAAFERVRGRGEGALIAYVTAGDPDPRITPHILDALIKGGVDILELGIPFSDPIADGPSIQMASARALASGTRPRMVLDMARQLRERSGVPIVLLSYMNPIFRAGPSSFLGLAKESGVDGLIVPDLPAEEAQDLSEMARGLGIDLILLASPSTSEERLKFILDRVSGFLYLVSLYGITGVRERLSAEVEPLISRARAAAKGRLPLAVGFGLSRPEHVQAVIRAGADGAIIGSAFVNIVAEHGARQEELLVELERAASEFKKHTRVSQPVGGRKPAPSLAPL